LERVEDFLHRHHAEARALGWTTAELFGCNPDTSFAFVRYDAMGAVTLSVCTGWPIGGVVPDQIQFANRLRFARGTSCSAAVPVWKLAPAQS
jgi:hypothetical protein